MKLEKLINKLIDQYMLDSKSVEYENLKNLTQERLERKISRLNSRNVWNIEPWHNYLDDEGHFYQRYEEEDFTILFRSDVIIEDYYNRKNNTLINNIFFENKNGNSILCLKNSNKAVFNNPITNKLESWTNLFSITRVELPKHKMGGYKKHLFEANYNGNEAKYEKDSNPQELELYAFTKGIGYLTNSSRMFIFIAFNVDIGTIKANNTRKPTHILKIQVDRVSRGQRQYRNKKNKILTRRQGYLTKIHGYPISFSELKSDFPAGHRKVNENKFDLPISL